MSRASRPRRSSRRSGACPTGPPTRRRSTTSERASVEAAADALTARLAELHGAFRREGGIALTGHAHIDLAWLWPYDETRRKLRRTFHTALGADGALARLPLQPVDARITTRRSKRTIPSCSPRFASASRPANGSRSAACGSSRTPTCPTGESLARQIALRPALFRARVRRAPSRLLAARLLRLLAGAAATAAPGGDRQFLHHQGQLVGDQQVPARPVLVGRARRRAACSRTRSTIPLGGYNGEVRPGCIAPTWANFRAKTRHDETLLAVGYGDGGGGVDARDDRRRSGSCAIFPPLPRARWSRVDEFFARAHESAATQRAAGVGAAKSISNCTARR